MIFNKIIFFFVIIICALPLMSQDPGHIPFDKKGKQLFEKARKLERKGKDKKALRLYEKLLDKYDWNIRLNLKLAGIYYNRKEDGQSLLYLEKALRIDSFYDPEIYYSIALINERKNNIEEAIKNFSIYINMESSNKKKQRKTKRHIQNLEFSIEAKKNPVDFEVIDPGENINTIAPEYMADLDVSMKHMVFSRRVSGQEDLYMSTLENGKWSSAEYLENINSPSNEAAHCISPDGKSIYFTSCDRRKGLGSCDLYVSHKKNGIWSVPENLGEVLNSIYWDAQPSISSDGNTLFFASNRPGGQGGRDIWFSHKNKNGKWTHPLNLGDSINTNYHEETPFIHPNNINLYFMSDGHPGMGGSDLYVATKMGDIWTNIKNLGFPINTEADEGAVRVASDGRTAFFSTDRFELSGNHDRNLNIYSFLLPPGCRAQSVAYVEGMVRDLYSGESLEASVELRDNNSVTLIKKMKSDKLEGFLVPLPKGYNYNLTIDKEGYVFYSENFALMKSEMAQNSFLLDIALLPIKKDGTSEIENHPTILNNIFFKSASSELDKESSKIELNRLLEFMQKNDTISIRIQGHTDEIGSQKDNLELSLNRARSIYEFLVINGISASRLEYEGFGESRPIASNDTEEGRRKNRRSEFLIIKALN